MVQFVTLPQQGGDPRQVSEVVRGVMDGKTNNTGTVTLAGSSATSTTFYNERIGYDSVILFEATTANAANKDFPYGAFSSSVAQTAASTTASQAFTFNSSDLSHGVTLSNSSRLNVQHAGVYNLQFSMQITNNDTQIQDMNIWIRQNGTDIPSSNGKFSIPNRHGAVDGNLIAAFNLFCVMAQNDYVELVWSTSSTLVRIDIIAAQSSPTVPFTPSTIATLHYVGANENDATQFTNMYISSQTRGSATISHPANTAADKTYKYIVVG